ncbi:MAG: hypothetical protein RBS80_04260 [Thermoguttaceae bacterium]|jgi:hypothetical protein|nr:hypothetical protein [Thermoguttaceae bacterium]
MPEMQVVINVHGGLVQEVFASGPLAELVVVDWDVAPGDHQAVEVQMGQRHLRASVQHPMVQPIGHLAGSDVEAVIDAAYERQQTECFPA